MRFITLFAVVVLLCGCVQDYAEKQFNFAEIENAAANVLSSNQVVTKEYAVHLLKIPVQIEALNPEFVYVTDQGLYIQLDSFFVATSGLFIPNQPIDNALLQSSDPKYTRLSDNVYSYIIKG